MGTPMDETNTPPPTPLPYAPSQRTRWDTVAAPIAAALGLLGLVILFLAGPHPESGLAFAVAAMAVALGACALRRARRGRALAACGLICGVLTIGLMPWSLWRERQLHDRVRRVISQAHLKAIGQAIQTYVDDSRVPPSDLQVLVDAGSVPHKQLTHPLRNPPSGRPSDYFYLPPSAGSPPDAIIACNYLDCDPKGRSVLLNDHTVRWLDMADFAAELAKPHNAAFAAALRAGEGP